MVGEVSNPPTHQKEKKESMSSHRLAPACLGTTPRSEEEWTSAIMELLEWLKHDSVSLFTASPKHLTLQWLLKSSLGNQGSLPTPSSITEYWKLWTLCLGSSAGSSQLSGAQAGSLLDSIAATARVLSSRQPSHGDAELAQALALCTKSIFESSLADVFQFEKVARFTGAVGAALLGATDDGTSVAAGGASDDDDDDIEANRARLEIVPVLEPLFKTAAQALLRRARVNGNQRNVFRTFFASPEPLLLPLLCVRHAAGALTALESCAQQLLLAAAYHDDHMRDYGSALSGVDTKAEETLQGEGGKNDDQKHQEEGKGKKNSGKGRGKGKAKSKGDTSKGDALVSYHRKLFQTLGLIMRGNSGGKRNKLWAVGPVSEKRRGANVVVLPISQ